MRPLRTTVIGSYPLPGWLEFASGHLDAFGPDDRAEIQRDAVVTAVHDQMAAGLDVVTDGEQTRLDFNLSFYGHLDGLEMEGAPPRRFGPPAHDQRGRHRVIGTLSAPRGLGVVAEFERLMQVVESGGWSSARDVALKASVPGPYTIAGRLEPNEQYRDRHALTRALIPIVRSELERLVAAGCQEITVDEPSMSCYAHREDTRRLVAIFNDTVESIVGKCRLSTHLCFGNYKGRAVGPRRYAPMFPAFLDFHVNEMHLEMASREFAEIECIAEVTRRMDVAIGVIDVKSYYIERPEDVADRIRTCLRYAPADRLAVAPDCGLSQTARWAARRKLANMVEGTQLVRRELGL